MSGQYALKVWGRELTPAYEKASWGWALFIASYFFLLGFSRLFTAPAAVLILVGLYQLVVQLKAYGWRGLAPAYKTYGVLFLLIWLPLLFSLTDAKYAHEAAGDTFKILAYFFSGFACVWLAKEKRVVQPLVVVLTGLALFWAADVIFQRLAGFDVFGVPYVASYENRAAAYFGNGVKFGSYLACMAMLALCYLAPRLASVRHVVLLWSLFTLALLCNMTRTAWLIYAVFSAPLLFVYVMRPVRHSWAWLGLALLLLGIGLGFYYESDLAFRNRMDRTLLILNGLTYENWNEVLTYRLDLWRAAWQMFCEHWINGLGLHAFTNDFNSYPAASFWTGIQPSHEHQYVLQVMVATGLIGLLGVIAIHVLLFLMWRRAGSGKAALFPLLVYLAAMWFPLNSHFPFYSSEWVWANLMILGLIAGGLGTDASGSRQQDSSSRQQDLPAAGA